ncbi:DUF3168 domain-containing protein [Sphingorhabdus arenilitoris]|uniref:DUF3168 domain-containing protein n=1 Tax=Sphingorhabdus arenilitoris TaxID=1490041 RepID=A0ABV8REY8_9SPHN
MSDAVIALQTAATAALETHPALAQSLNGVYDGPPVRAVFPYIAFTENLVTDWSTKTETGREVRLAFTIWDDGDVPARLHQLIGHSQEAIAALPEMVGGWQIASNIFLRGLIARDAAGPWAALVEHRIRMLQI